MRYNNLAVVVPTQNFPGSDQTLRETVWQQVTQLLLPQLGTLYTRFQPAEQAWTQAVDRPFGVVLGRSDPALFLYFYTAAKASQEAAIHSHIEKVMDGVDIAEKHMEPGVTMYTVEVKGNNQAMEAHMQWHIAMMGGQLLPDFGIYFTAQKQAFADKALDKKVISNLGDYALCMVNLIQEDKL